MRRKGVQPVGGRDPRSFQVRRAELNDDREFGIALDKSARRFDDLKFSAFRIDFEKVDLLCRRNDVIYSDDGDIDWLGVRARALV
nr:hypothetical protein [Burkholderia vietnamiensis]